jgi:hypothetical protein
LAIASVPVSATEPEANARISSRIPTPDNRSGVPWLSSAGCAPSPFTTTRNTPTAIITSADTTNR